MEWPRQELLVCLVIFPAGHGHVGRYDCCTGTTQQYFSGHGDLDGSERKTGKGVLFED